MASNVQKTPMVRSLLDLGRASAGNAQELTGKSLPCSVTSVTGSIVRVKFEVAAGELTLPQVTMPVFGPEYIRYPIQIGCKGLAVSADAFLGAMSGLGTGVADLSTQPNLSTLFFMPLGNANFFSVDANKVVIYGENGAIMRNRTGSTNITLTDDSIILTVGAHSVVITASGISVDGKDFLTHRHKDVTAGISNTGTVV